MRGNFVRTGEPKPSHSKSEHGYFYPLLFNPIWPIPIGAALFTVELPTLSCAGCRRHQSNVQSITITAWATLIQFPFKIELSAALFCF